MESNINLKKNKIPEYKFNNNNKTNSILIKEELRKNNNLNIQDIKEQKEQKRNRSKKAKKSIENINKNQDNKTITSINTTSKMIYTKKNISNKIDNVNNINNNINEDYIDKYLKNKAKITSNNKKNFLSSSINFSLIHEFDIQKPNPKPKTEIKKYTKIDNIKESLLKEKEDEVNKININNILIPMINMAKENNCFLNVLIQVLFNLQSFKKNILKCFNQNSLNIKDEVVFEFYNLIKSYNLEQIKNEKNEMPLQPNLSVNQLRNKLNNKFGNYFKGDCGDPMECLEHIFNSIHDEFISDKDNILSNNNKSKGTFDCPIHQFFYLDLMENLICQKCGSFHKRRYDKNCYMFQIFVSELSKRIMETNPSFENMRLKLFYQIKEQNQKYDISNARIEGCKCAEINNTKRLNLLRVNNTYVIINLTWSEEFPDLQDILNIYTSLPLVDKNKHLFNVGEENDQKLLYIKAIILYGIYHYICVIYLNKFKKWGIIDDKTIKFIDKYYDLVEYLLRNHLSPVGLIYSYDPCDKIDDIDMRLNLLTKDKYLQILNFCKGVDNKKSIKMSYISKSKESLSEINENYLDNNLFSSVFIKELINSSTSSNNEEKEDREFRLKKSSNKKSSEEENEKNSEDMKNIQKVDMKLKEKGKNIKSSIFLFDD